MLLQQKKKRDRLRQSILQYQIPDAPTLEEFECLLGESPTNYPKGEAVEDIESELHSAAIDTEVYEKQAAEEAAYEKERSLQNVETTNEVDNLTNLHLTSMMSPMILRYIIQEKVLNQFYFEINGVF